MLDRNRRIKEKPERFQESDLHFDLILTCQERVFDQTFAGQCLLLFSALDGFRTRYISVCCSVLYQLRHADYQIKVNFHAYEYKFVQIIFI